VSVKIPKGGFEPAEELLAIKTAILKKDLPRILKTEQKKGFPEEYDLLMTQRGRQTKRQLRTLNPAFFNIGNVKSPTTFEFVADGNWETVVEAIKFAVSAFVRRAPTLTGRYINSLEIETGGRQLRAGGLSRVTQTLNAKSTILLGPTAEYSSTIEAGHYTGYYANALRGGILYFVWREVVRKFGATVSCRMIYVNLAGSRLAQPVLEFGIAGAFASNATTPGTNIRRRARKARR
jgi:hypothetical protein